MLIEYLVSFYDFYPIFHSMKNLFLILSLFSTSLVAIENPKHRGPVLSKEVTHFSFGSCNKQKRDQSFWQTIKSIGPEFFILLGDNIYSNAKKAKNLRKDYQTLKSNPHYQDFISEIPMIATWDDHDYGTNNSNRFNPIKDESQDIFLTFFNEPKNSPRWKRNGIFTSYTMGTGDRKIKVILLDTRYHKDAWILTLLDDVAKKVDVDYDAQLLGEQQWRWLEEELTNSTAQIHFIASGMTYYSGHVLWKSESWADYPNEYNRLINLLERTQVKAPIFLSGDKHFGGIFERVESSGNTYYEIMSSGLTHSAGRVSAINSFINLPWFSYTLKKNFADVYIDWGKEIILTAFIRKLPSGKVKVRRKFKVQDGRLIRVK